MPLYPADFMADTTHLSAAETGAYLMLIMHYWRAGSLPSDEKMLRRISRMGEREWQRSRDILAAFFFDGWRHKRIESEIAKSALKSTARAECGRRGGEAKALKLQGASLAKATNLPVVSQPRSKAKALASSSQPQPDKEPSSKVTPRAVLETVLSADIADGVIAHRRAIRKPITVLAAEGLARSFAETGQPDAAARMMIERAWTGFKAEWFVKEAKPQAGRFSSDPYVNSLAEALHDSEPEQPPYDGPTLDLRPASSDTLFA